MSGADGQAQTIVCVDDDALVLDALREQLQRGLGGGCNVETANGGAEALQLLEDLHTEGVQVPLLISDQHMPGMDGADFLARVHLRYPAILKIMLSGQADLHAVGQAVNRAGLYRILSKPWNRDDLVLTVREALRSVAQQLALARTHEQLERSMQQMRHQALHDVLTGLPNRAQFDQALHAAMAQAQREHGQLAVLFIDLDRFKRINDTLGHAVGDQLLCSVAQRLRQSVREQDTIARWGGDEFTVLLPRVDELREAHAVAQRILAALEPALVLETHPIHISASIGVAVFPQDGETSEALVKNADAALYCVKAEGRNGWRAYSGGCDELDTRLALETALHGAIERGELALHYQPQFDVRSGEITHVEALARWHHPVHGKVPPGTFIALAEEGGLIHQLGQWVLNEACRQTQVWNDADLGELCVCVNVSALQFERGDLANDVRQALASSGLPARLLELEITEAAGLRNRETTAATLALIHATGVSIALDDFGTGFAPLSYLKDLPCQVLKIDRSFVQALEADSKDAAIVSAVIALGHGLGMRVVAEGVETAEAESLLRTWGCDSLQGYRFARPEEPERIEQRLRASRWSRRPQPAHLA